MSSLDTILRNGDIVEIMTSKNSHPNTKWLDYTKTSFARRRIRAYIEEHGGLLGKFTEKNS